MKLELFCAWRNILKLVRFLVLYVGGVALLFYLLPLGAGFLELHYEAMSGLQKVAVIVAFSLLLAARQFVSWRQSQRNETP